MFILITSICTVKVHITANRKRRRITNAEPTTSEQEEQQIRLKEYKQTFSMSLMVLASVILYCPFMAVMITRAIEGKEVTNDFKYIAPDISIIFVNLQSLVNPIIFSLRLSYIHEGVKNKLFCCKWHVVQIPYRWLRHMKETAINVYTDSEIKGKVM